MNKGILLWTEVVCACCGTRACGEFVRHGRRQMRAIKAELSKDGWTMKRGETYCHACKDKVPK